MGKNKAVDLFTKGNSHYAKSEYKQAATVYEQLLKDGFQSTAVYFNLGNAYYKLDEIPLAILNYEKAYKRSPNDEDIKVNLQLANQKIDDKIETVPPLFLNQWWHSFILAFSLNAWSVLGTTLFFVGFLALIVYLFAQAVGVKKTAFYSGISCLVLAMVCLIAATAQQRYFDKHQEAILFSGAVNVKSAPNDQTKTLFVIHEGTKVKIAKREGDWVKIELSNGNVGWIAYNDLRII
ncbi:tetratricopeptide repeat protein [Olivibacter ginsenosidimutans]|uniref:Tetratricopeptide repeat protein n=1 Tax=Olivibacter ginsenosidimutans TaxID=1176537 RepID=A0ABP9AZW7_9SPHI